MAACRVMASFLLAASSKLMDCVFNGRQGAQELGMSAYLKKTKQKKNKSVSKCCVCLYFRESRRLFWSGSVHIYTSVSQE